MAEAEDHVTPAEILAEGFRPESDADRETRRKKEEYDHRQGRTPGHGRQKNPYTSGYRVRREGKAQGD